MNRCAKCNRKNSFFIRCKCGKEYCTRDLLPEKHNCEAMDAYRKDAFEKNKCSIMKSAEKKKEEWITTTS